MQKSPEQELFRHLEVDHNASVIRRQPSLAARVDIGAYAFDGTR